MKVPDRQPIRPIVEVGGVAPGGPGSGSPTSSWIPFMAWLDRGVRVGLSAYGTVYLLMGWVALQLAFGDHAERASSSGAIQELARHELGRVVVSAIAFGMGTLVLWRLLEVVVGHRDKEQGVTAGEPARSRASRLLSTRSSA